MKNDKVTYNKIVETEIKIKYLKLWLLSMLAILFISSSIGVIYYIYIGGIYTARKIAVVTCVILWAVATLIHAIAIVKLHKHIILK